MSIKKVGQGGEYQYFFSKKKLLNIYIVILMFPIVFIFFNIFKIQFTILTIKRVKIVQNCPKYQKSYCDK